MAPRARSGSLCRAHRQWRASGADARHITGLIAKHTKGARMRRTLRLFLCQCLLAGLALSQTAAAQETRGKISGTVRDNAGVIPGASITVTNTDTGVNQNLTTNQSGYFEAPLLNPGTYSVKAQM